MTEANPKPVASEPRPIGKQPEPEEPPEEPGLPFLPQPISVDPTIAVPEPALTAVTTSEGEPQPVPDNDPSRPAQPPCASAGQDSGAAAGRTGRRGGALAEHLRLRPGTAGDGVGQPDDLGYDSARARSGGAGVPRVGVRLLVLQQGRDPAEVEAIGDSTRLKNFDATFDDSALVSALDAWSEARRGSPAGRWAAIAKAQQDAAVELDSFHGTIDRTFTGTGDIERSLLEILEAAGREIGRESAEQVWGSQIDFGTTLGGVTYAVRLASPTETVLQARAACSPSSSRRGRGAEGSRRPASGRRSRSTRRSSARHPRRAGQTPCRPRSTSGLRRRNA